MAKKTEEAKKNGGSPIACVVAKVVVNKKAFQATKYTIHLFNTIVYLLMSFRDKHKNT